ncbi:MAG: hypothetical protein IJ775_04725, partial [Muribaculaceae bacterium]|nr:hypothetical protein [Muribaculaceae bacterium]
MATLLLLSALVTQAATKYDINVAGVEVTSDNASNIKGGDIKSGTVTFNNSTKTLTLTNVTITRTGSGDYAIHNRSYKGLIVKFVGTCNLTTKARVIRFQSGGNWSDTETPLAAECQLVATSGAVVNMTSTGDGAIYVRDFTSVWIKGPGTFNITGNKDGAIAGHGQWNSSATDLATIDAVKFSNVTATVTGAQGSLLGLAAHFYAGTNLTLKATGNMNYPIARELYGRTKFFNNTDILTPWDWVYSSTYQSFVIGNSKLYYTDIFISDNYALQLKSYNFPDANFHKAMRELYPKGYLTQTELQNFTSLDVISKSISDLSGVEKLTYLKTLKCARNSLTSLPSLPSTLTSLNCSNNRFSGSLSLTGRSALKTLDVSYNNALTSLYCYSNALTTLNVYASPLTTLDCHSNQLTSLGTLPSTLQTLKCGSNKLSGSLS